MSLKKIAQNISVAVLFIIPLFPLIVTHNLFFPFITGKAFYFRILIEIAFAAWVILAFLEPKYRPKINKITISVTIFTLVTLVADLLGENPLRSLWSNFERMEGWFVILHLWMFYMVATNIFGSGETGKKFWQRWMNTSLGVATIIGIYGLIQLFGWAEIHQGSRIDASLGNAAYLAVYMLFHIFIAAYLFFARANSVESVDFPQWIYAILSVFFSFLLVETATRGTTLGLIGGVLLSSALYVLFAKREAKKSRLRAGLVIVAILVIGVVFWFNRDASFIQNNEALRRMASISLQESKTQARGYIWPMAIKGWQERPILGWGQENFNYIFNSHYDPKMWAHEQWFDRAHSVYLDWLTASGIVGLLAYLVLYVFCIWAIWKSSLTIKEKTVLVGLIVGYAIHNVFVFDNLASYVFFFALLGFASSLKEGKHIHVLGSKPVRGDVVEYVVAPIVLILLVVGLYFIDVRPVRANVALLNSLAACTLGNPSAALFEKALAVNSYTANQEIREQLLACGPSVFNNNGVSNNTKVAFSGLISREIKNQEEATPKDARIYTLVGIFMNSIGAFADAEPALVEAVKLSPGKQSIMIQLALAYANNNKASEALDLMKQAYESAPDNIQAKSAYASMFVISNKEAEGRSLLKDPGLFENQTTAEIYAALRKFPQSIALYKKLISADPSNVQLRGGLAQVQRTAGLKTDAINTLTSIGNDFPEYKAGIDDLIKQIKEGK